MAGIITALKIQKRNKERVNVYLDDEYTLAVTAVVATGLKKGQYLTDSQIEKLKSQDERAKAYNRALRFLGYRARSQREIERYLEDKGYSPGAVTATVERLLGERYLDDEAFARAWLEDRKRFRPRGQQALRYELKQKGLGDEIIDAALADLDEMELAWKAVERKLDQWGSLDQTNFKKKLFGFLGRRGFDYEVIYTVFDRAWAFLNSPE